MKVSRPRTPYIGQPFTRFPNMPKAVKVEASAVLPHLTHLMSLGMSPCMIARAAGVSSGPLYKILAGNQDMILKPTVDALLSVTPRPHPQQANVLAFAARRRLAGLAVMGWPNRAIASEAGLHLSSISRVHGNTCISLQIHTDVVTVYERISHVRRGDPRAMNWARRKGAVHPMLWDDIDDFYEVPTVPSDSGLPDLVAVERLVSGRAVAATAADKRVAFERLIRRGVSVNAAAVQLGINYQTAVRYSEQLVAA